MSFFSWLRNRTSTRAPHGARQKGPMAPRFRPRLEALEDRWLPSTLTVMNNQDSGVGSLRADIAAAQSGDTIVFAPNLNGQTITLTSGELSITKGLTIQGPGAGQLTVSGNNMYRAFEVNAGQPVILSGLRMIGRDTFGANPLVGGAILNHTVLTVSGCTITGHAQLGGGIGNFGTLTVSGCTLIGASASEGSGIFNSTSGNLTVSASTLSSDSDGGYLSDGGGIYAGGLATLTNCTLSGNTAGLGGGLFVAGRATLTNCTLSLNSAGQGGGIYVSPTGNLNLTNTIVARNPGRDIFGAVLTAKYNLVGDATGSTGIVNGVDGNIVGGNGHPVINPLLGPLQNNGGPTQTMALLPGSLAIGHGNNAFAPAKDQRGFTRLDELGERTDIGAFEL